MFDKDHDHAVLRDLAGRYMEICHDPVQAERRELWRKHNSLEKTRPLIYIRGGNSLQEVPSIAQLQCTDPFFHPFERDLRIKIFRGGLNDDSTFEPWIDMPAVFTCSGWGLEPIKHMPDDPKGAFKMDYPLESLDDIDKLQTPCHQIDQTATDRDAGRLQEAFGDAIEVNIDRSTAYRMWTGCLSSTVGRLRGIENLMFDMIDNPAGLHRLMAFMRDGILAVHDRAEADGDWGLHAHENQAMPYANETAAPAAGAYGAPRKQLWGYQAAQELTLVSPQMHDEFMLQYQIPILANFGLSAYGCCEDLTRKIDILRRIPNLRRIAVAPLADVAGCAEQIGTDYVISYRPNPAEMVCCGFDADYVEKFIRRDLDICRGLHVDITLKDVTTVQNQPDRYAKWTDLVRRIVDDYE